VNQWILIGALTACVLAALLWPLLARRKGVGTEQDQDLAIYRDQLDEIDRDLERGLLSADEADAARTEIKRRVLSTRARAGGPKATAGRSPVMATAVAVVACAAAFGIYLFYGAPGTPDLPLAERQQQENQDRAVAGDIESRIEALAERAKQNPDDFEIWWLLGQSYAFVGRYGEAADAYRRAVELSGDAPDVLATYAEAVVLANGNRVTVMARLAFEQVRSQVPDDPRARYYLALHAAQNEQYREAMDGWLALLEDSPPDAAWIPLLRERIADMAGLLDIDVATVLPDLPAGAPAQSGGAGPRAEIDRLRAQLAQNEKDYQGWIQLARAHAALGEIDAARGALEEVSRLYPSAPFVQQQIQQAAAELDVGGSGGTRGPSDADIAAASAMTEAERAEMISGMVDGLAARLDENPNDPDGWIMLIRSYSVLGRRDEAAEAAKKALAALADQDRAVEAVRRTAAEFNLAVE